MSFKDSQPSWAVSAVIPLYNAEPFIEETLTSLANQTFPIQEIIVIDDHSQDDSMARCQRWVQSAPMPVSLLQPPQKYGVSKIRNWGVSLAQHPWVLFMDADDTAEPELVEQTYDTYRFCLTRYQQPIGLLHCAYRQVDEIGNIISDPVRFQQLDPKETFGGLLMRNMISTSGAIVNRHLFLETGGFDENMRFSEDWDLWLRLAQKNVVFGYVENPLVSVRRYSRNTSSRPDGMLQAEPLVLSKYPPTLIEEALYKRKLPPAKNKMDYAILLFRMNAWEEGYKVLQELLNENQDSDPTLHFYRGLYFLHNEQIEKAQGCFEKTCQLSSAHGAALNNLAITKALLGFRKEAKALLKRTIEYWPDYQDACYNLRLLEQNEGHGLQEFRMTSRELRSVLIRYS